MITYTPAGRLGNALFQTAMIFQYALKHGIDFHVPSTTNDKYWNPIYFPHLRNPNFNPRLSRILIQEKTHAYHDVPFNPAWKDKNIFLSGYWQTEKYFAWCRNELLEALAIPWKMNKGVVSIHIRRGDYLKYPEKHPPVSLQYIFDAVEKFPKKHFRMFSDDIPWCKDIFGARKDFSFSEGLDEMQDLAEMSCCEHHIGSSSTYSWWANWLNRNPKKIIYTPKLWFVPNHGGLDVSDIIPKTWIKL